MKLIYFATYWNSYLLPYFDIILYKQAFMQ